VACNLNGIFKNEGLVKATGSHVRTLQM